jgi:hypothetical protein
MEVAAELRAQGATWQIIALKLKRQLALVHRWTTYYAEEWDQLLGEAEERLHRQAGDESRAVLRELLHSKKSNVRLAAAKRLARLRLQEKAKEPPPVRTDLAAWIQAAEEMSDAELEQYLGEFLGKTNAGGMSQIVPKCPAKKVSSSEAMIPAP